MERLSYGELIRAGWMLLWRIVTAIFGLVSLIDTLLVWTMPELVRSAPSLWASAVPLTLAVLLTLFVVMPWALRAFLNKQFRGFHFLVVHGSH
jgi:hypothetical protein